MTSCDQWLRLLAAVRPRGIPSRQAPEAQPHGNPEQGSGSTRPLQIPFSGPSALKSAGLLALHTLVCGLLLLVAACDDPPPPAADQSSSADSVQQLDQLTTAQRRVFLKGFPGDWRGDTEMARGLPAPPPGLPVPGDATIIELPETGDMQLGEVALPETIARRRSRREFTDQSLSLDQLSYLLANTQGITAVTRNESGELSQQFRAAPSGGGRYPLETFLALQRVDSLAAGLYRYLPQDHRLLLIAEDPGIGEKLRQACYGNATAGEAAVVFIWATVPHRTEWKYGCIAHKMIAIEAGHVCQNLYLAAESIETGTCAMLGYHQPALDALIGADGVDLFTIYLAAVGNVLHP